MADGLMHEAGLSLCWGNPEVLLYLEKEGELFDPPRRHCRGNCRLSR